jgi:hypothetical protein
VIHPESALYLAVNRPSRPRCETRPVAADRLAPVAQIQSTSQQRATKSARDRRVGLPGGIILVWGQVSGGAAAHVGIGSVPGIVSNAGGVVASDVGGRDIGGGGSDGRLGSVGVVAVNGVVVPDGGAGGGVGRLVGSVGSEGRGPPLTGATVMISVEDVSAEGLGRMVSVSVEFSGAWPELPHAARSSIAAMDFAMRMVRPRTGESRSLLLLHEAPASGLSGDQSQDRAVSSHASSSIPARSSRATVIPPWPTTETSVPARSGRSRRARRSSVPTGCANDVP